MIFVLFATYVIVQLDDSASFQIGLQKTPVSDESNSIVQQNLESSDTSTSQSEVLPSLSSTNNDQISISSLYYVLGFAFGSNAILIVIVIRIMQRESKQKLRYEKFATIGELSARLSHDLRNPLSMINLMVGMLKMKNDEPELDEKYQIILNSVKRMKIQLDDVLTHVRKNGIRLSNSSLRKIIEQSIDELIIPEDIQVILPENNISVQCDPFKIQSVITNIIGNSIQAMGENYGEIKITLFEDANYVICDIQDSGPGIKEKHLSKIFEPTFTTKQTGTGLGLATCKSIVEAHNGQLSVKNNPTTFTFSLPKNPKITKTKSNDSTKQKNNSEKSPSNLVPTRT